MVKENRLETDFLSGFYSMAEKETFNAIFCSASKHAYFSIVMLFFFGFWQTMNAVNFRFI